MRVAELLTENQKNKQVVGLKEVDQVIAVMGQPEDYIIEEDNHDTHSYSGAAPEKQIIPDTEKDDQRVSAGLGHYFGIDAVWVG
jgi:hypothetical protein